MFKEKKKLEITEVASLADTLLLLQLLNANQTVAGLYAQW